MKSIKSIFILLAILLLTACSSSNNIDVSREDILGTWELSDQSLKKTDLQKESITTTSFQLNADSTASFYLGDSPDRKVDGRWTWKNEKRIGSENFGVSIENDVMIYGKRKIHDKDIWVLGLKLREGKNGEITLMAQNKIYEKQ
jgi:hypothetical protein